MDRSLKDVRPRFPRWLLGAVLLSIPAVALLALGGSGAAASGSSNLLVLAPLAFLAGLLSFLSPCCLPVLSAYVAYTVQTRREQVVPTTLAFFGGLATTMIALGATASALSALLFQSRAVLTLVGGLVIIVFGVLSLLGKGFSGPQLRYRPSATVGGSYLYGLIFGLGWTACVGPILGALLTMLATQGVAVLQGAVLALIYALGLGAPLVALGAWFSRLGPQSRVWKFVRGRGFTLTLGARTLHLHTTSVASGLLLIGVGALLATGQLATLSQWAVQTPLTQWVLGLEDNLRVLVTGR